MANGLLSSVDLALKSCKIIATSGQAVDFSGIIAEFSYFEDIFGFGISGNFLVNDSVGYINTMQLHGEEKLVLEFSKPGMDNPIEKIFRVYKISNRQQNSFNNENYIVHFCSEELILNEQYKVTKSYQKALISDMISDILLNYLKIDQKHIAEIEQTVRLRDLTVPLFKPLRAISWLTTLALSGEKNSIGAPFLFYENKNGINFKSALNLFKQEPYNTYYYEPKGLKMDSGVTDIGKEMVNAIKYELIQSFDSSFAVSSGMYANKLVTFDPVRLKFGETNFNYNQYKQNAETVDSSGLPITNPNRMGDTLDNTTGVIKFAVSNSGLSENQYVKDKQISVQENAAEQTIPYRTAQMAMFVNNRVKLMVPGDPNLTVGLIVNFVMPTIAYSNQNTKEKDQDQFYSGKYLVTALRHYFNQENKFFTIIEICKDSFSNKYGDSNFSDTQWKA